MKTATKWLSLLLALLMAMSIVLTACSKPADDTTAATQKPADETTAAPEVEDNTPKCELPEDLSFKGETFRFFYRLNLADYNIVGSTEGNDNISIAVFKRNQMVKDRLGFEINFIPSVNDAWKEVSAEIRTVVSSAEDSWDVLASSGNSLIQYYLGEYLRDASDLKYVDYEKPWWYLDGIKELSLDGETYRFLIGDLLPSNFINAGVIYVNKDIFNKTYGDYTTVPQLVLDGGWTHDKFFEYVNGCYYDENGTTTVDDGDILGLIGPKPMGSDYFQFSTDAISYERDANGKPVIALNNDRVLGVLDTLLKLYALPNVVLHTDNSGDSGPNFAAGKSLFLIQNFNYLVGTTLRASDVNYGVLPVPKYDLSQENYISFIHNSSAEVAIPKTCADSRLDMIGAALEAFSYQGYVTVIPELYDIALKQKYSTTPEDSMMIDIVHDSLTKDLMYEYSANLNNIGTIVRQLLAKNSADFASSYQSKITKAEELLDGMYQADKGN